MRWITFALIAACALFFAVSCSKDDDSSPTDGGGNQPPRTPSNALPANGASSQALDVDLSWSCADPDNDTLSYDVYFGVAATPPRVSVNQSATTYDPGTLIEDTLYYWRIIAKDGRGHTTEGPVWHFATATPPNSSQSLIPLAVGNWWVYHWEDRVNGWIDSAGTDTLRVVTSFSWNGNTWFSFGDDRFYFRNAADGFRKLIVNGHYPSEIELLEYKYPALAGESWWVKVDTDSLQVKVISTTAQKTVPAGSFDRCMHYRWHGDETNEYFKPGVGQIYFLDTWVYDGDTLSSEDELTAYHIQ